MQCKSAIEAIAQREKIFRELLKRWMELVEVETILRIPYDTTVLLQKQNSTLSDLYGTWMRCELLLLLRKDESILTNLATYLLTCLKERKGVLFSNRALVCALFLDPRFRSQLDADQDESAKATILVIYEKLKKVKPESSINISVVDITAQEIDILDEYLSETDPTKSQDKEPSQSGLQIVLNEITEFEKNEKRLPANYSILKYWIGNKEKYPNLFLIAEAINGIPPTQVSVERSFSTLGIIYNSKRVQLKQQMLENIIHLKLNKDMVYAIFDTDLKELAVE